MQNTGYLAKIAVLFCYCNILKNACLKSVHDPLKTLSIKSMPALLQEASSSFNTGLGISAWLGL